MNIIELRDVRKTFGNTVAVDGLSLDVAAGSIYGFIGPNGSGKTTTLRMIMNIFYPDSGTIRVDGRIVDGFTSRVIGYLPEERGLYTKMKVWEVLQFFGELKTGAKLDGEIDAWLKRFDLTAFAAKKVDTLSKGMAQKVQLIAAVLGRPKLLLLDEPFSGLDPVNADVLREAVLELRSQGTTIVFSTHDMNMAERMCDRIFMIFKGRKVLDGTLEELQNLFSTNILRIQSEQGAAVLTGLTGIEKIADFGQVQELRLARDCDAQALLAAIMARTRVFSFEITKPSLYDIFIRIAGPEASEVRHA